MTVAPRPGGFPAGIPARRAEGATPSEQPARCRHYNSPARGKYLAVTILDHKVAR